jgi:PAS domain S-box-containing protein
LLSHWPVFFVPVYQSLALLQFPLQQTEHAAKLNQNLEKLRVWARHAPMNFQHKLDMVLAERERVAGNVGLAIGHYEQAIAGAKQNKFLQDEALANELYGRFWYDRGNLKIAELYLREAYALYRHWGAGAITAYLEAQYPQWLNPNVINVSQSDFETSVSAPQSYFDLHSVLRAAEAISGELDLEKLLQTMMTIVMENAGAQRAFLIIERNGQWIVEAEGHSGREKANLLQGVDVADSDQVSAGVVNYVAHTQQMVLLADAAAAGRFVQDPAIEGRQVKSLLCMPLINRSRLSGILYLENNIATHVFNAERVELLALLSAQMAISLDHARLYDHLADEVTQRTRDLSFAEEQIRTLFATSQVGISLTNVEGEILAANEAMLRMMGYSEEEIPQHNVNEFFVDPRQRDELLERLSTSSAINNFGVKLQRKDGSAFFANVNVSRVVQDGQEVLLAMIEDVSDRKRAEEALQISQQFVQSALDALPDHIAILDSRGTILAANEPWRRFADQNGLAWDDFGVGRNYLEVAETASGGLSRDGHEAAAGLREVLGGKREGYLLEYPCHSPQEERWFMLRATRFENSEGLRLVVSHQDITERKRLQQQLQDAAKAAERQRLARDLHDSATQSLYSATLLSEAGQELAAAGDLESAKHYLSRVSDVVYEALKEMRLLVFQLRPAVLDKEGLVVALQRRLDAVERQSGIEARLISDKLPVLPNYVEDGLYRIAQEALNNVLKHAEADAVTVTVRLDGRTLVLEVVDDGCGFHREAANGGGGMGLANMRERAAQ